jgi:hypothetical protein
MAASPRSLGEMVESRRIDMISGCRINLAHVESTGTTVILSADPASGGLQIDPLVAAQHYGHARRTKAGDVIFTARPRPVALVDDVGGAMVLTPSRILRLPAGAGIGPRGLAAAINQLPANAGEWGTWSIPRLADDQIELVEKALAGAVAHIEEIRRREEAMNELITNLILGVAVGDLAISASTTKKKAG